jgi:hypothetical protein
MYILAVKIAGLMDSFYSPELYILESMFQKLDLFPSSGGEWDTPTLLGPLVRSNLNHWTKLYLKERS